MWPLTDCWCFAPSLFDVLTFLIFFTMLNVLTPLALTMFANLFTSVNPFKDNSQPCICHHCDILCSSHHTPVPRDSYCVPVYIQAIVLQCMCSHRWFGLELVIGRLPYSLEVWVLSWHIMLCMSHNCVMECIVIMFLFQQLKMGSGGPSKQSLYSSQLQNSQGTSLCFVMSAS